MGSTLFSYLTVKDGIILFVEENIQEKSGHSGPLSISTITL